MKGAKCTGYAGLFFVRKLSTCYRITRKLWSTDVPIARWPLLHEHHLFRQNTQLLIGLIICHTSSIYSVLCCHEANPLSFSCTEEKTFFFFWEGTVLCIVGCLVAHLDSIYPLGASSTTSPKCNTLGTAKCSLGAKPASAENRWANLYWALKTFHPLPKCSRERSHLTLQTIIMW